MSRRGRFAVCAVLALGLAQGTAQAGPAGAGTEGAPGTVVDTFAFDVYLDGKRIGSHTWEIRERPSGGREVYSEADFEVRFLFVTAFDYEHRNAEQWRDGCLAAISAETIRNGDRLRVQGRQSGQGLVVAAGAEERFLPGCVMSFAYWNPAFLSQEQLLNPQTGQFVPVDVERAAADGEDGRTGWIVRAENQEITVWYDAAQRWVGLEAPARGGRTLRYVRS